MPDAEQLDIGMETHSNCIVLKLLPHGLVGGSLSQKDVDDDFKRVSEADGAINSSPLSPRDEDDDFKRVSEADGTINSCPPKKLRT